MIYISETMRYGSMLFLDGQCFLHPQFMSRREKNPLSIIKISYDEIELSVIFTQSDLY